MISILWVDDDFGGGFEKSKALLNSFKSQIEVQLRRDASLEASVDAMTFNAQVLKAIADGSYDLIIVDLELSQTNLDQSRSNNHKAQEGIDIISSLERLDVFVPIIVVSNHVGDLNLIDIGDKPIDLVKEYRNCIGSYNKKQESIDELCVFLCDYFSYPPLRVIAISDIHIKSSEADSEESLVESLCATFKNYTKNQKVDLLAIVGDLVVKGDHIEHLKSPRLVRRFANALGLTRGDQIAITPGNHDYRLDSRPGMVGF